MERETSGEIISFAGAYWLNDFCAARPLSLMSSAREEASEQEQVRGDGPATLPGQELVYGPAKRPGEELDGSTVSGDPPTSLDAVVGKVSFPLSVHSPSILSVLMRTR